MLPATQAVQMGFGICTDVDTSRGIFSVSLLHVFFFFQQLYMGHQVEGQRRMQIRKQNANDNALVDLRLRTVHGDMLQSFLHRAS